MTCHNHTLGGLLYLLNHASDNAGLQRDTLSAYAEQTNESLTVRFLELPTETAEDEAIATAFYELLTLVRAAGVAANYAQSGTLRDLGRIIRELAMEADVTHS